MNKMWVFLLFVSPPVLSQLVPSSRTDDQVAKEVPLIRKDLPDVPGKEALVETVAFSPGEVVPAHRHNADVFAYVLGGSIVTQLKGGKPQIVHSGEVFYESPTDIHLASRNASKTQPAKLLVFFVKKTGAPPTVRVANTAHLNARPVDVEHGRKKNGEARSKKPGVCDHRCLLDAFKGGQPLPSYVLLLLHTLLANA